MRSLPVWPRHSTRAAIVICGVVASVLSGVQHAAAQDAGQKIAPVMIDSKSPVPLYDSPVAKASTAIAPASAFPLRSEGKENGRYKVQVNGGTYYLKSMDVSVRQPAQVVCAAAADKPMAGRLGAASSRCP